MDLGVAELEYAVIEPGKGRSDSHLTPAEFKRPADEFMDEELLG
ncbi:MAG: hypothetical protein ABEK16_05640 [Candidatus Nanohalobium sp.]